MKFTTILLALFVVAFAYIDVATPSLNTTGGAHRMTQEIDDFVPLSCNENIGLCKPWSDRLGTESTYSKRLVIPCGECLTMDLHSLTLNGGLDIRGKLVVPDGHDLTMHSTSIVVQGKLEMNATKAVDGVPLVRFVIIGQDESFFTPIHENENACGGACNIGKQAIVVAGGKLTSKYNSRATEYLRCN